MSKRILLLAASACLMAGHATAHQLAFSKAEQVSVNVPGDADSWCKPVVEMTIERPTWEDREPLDRLLSKIPFILGQECPDAKYQWEAVSANGQSYATGSGTAQNLGLVTLTEPEKQVVEAKEVAKATPESPDVPEQQPAEQAQELAEAPASLNEDDAVTQKSESLQSLGRELISGSDQYVQVADQNGCLWFMARREVRSQEPDRYRVQSEGATCVGGYAQGHFDKAHFVTDGNRMGQGMRDGFVHASGVIFDNDIGVLVKDLPLSFVKHDATQALFSVGEIADANMNVYAAFERGNNSSSFRPYGETPYYVGVTADGAFAHDEKNIITMADRIQKKVLAAYKGEVRRANLFVATDLDLLYPQYRAPNRDHLIFTGRIQSAGEALTNDNWFLTSNDALARKRVADQKAMANLQINAEYHTRFLADYATYESDQKSSGLSMAVYSGKRLGYVVSMPSPLELMSPRYSNVLLKALVKVEGKKGDGYAISYPGKAVITTDHDLEPGWHLINVAAVSYISELKGGFADPIFKAYLPNDYAGACKLDQCADVLGYGAVLRKDWEEAMPDFDWESWTPQVSQDAINEYQRVIDDRSQEG